SVALRETEWPPRGKTDRIPASTERSDCLMAFGMRDTLLLCEQYRAAMRRQLDFDGRYGALSDRLARLEQAVRFMATVASVRRLTDAWHCSRCWSRSRFFRGQASPCSTR